LAQAEKAKERAERIIGPGGKRVLRQYVGAFLANNPDKAQQRSLKISAAQQNIDASTANINSIQQQKADAQAATTPEQPQPSTPEQVPPQEQVPPEQQQQQAPPQEQVPPEQQQQQAPPQEQVPPRTAGTTTRRAEDTTRKETKKERKSRTRKCGADNRTSCLRPE
jgi:outer membrane biosynthesis protein TonB